MIREKRMIERLFSILYCRLFDSNRADQHAIVKNKSPLLGAPPDQPGLVTNIIAGSDSVSQ